MSGTKVKILKDGLWAVNPPNPGELRVTEGEERDDIPNHLIQRMLHADSGPAVKIIGGKKKDSEDTPKAPHVLDDVSDIRATLTDIADNADNKNEAKDLLEVWGKENLNFDVDKRRSCENVIADLIAEYEEQNG